MINFFKSCGSWINCQLEWIKSFFNEPDSGKGSNKRFLSTMVVFAFLIPYYKVSLAKTYLEDIPTGWALMIGAIIGLNIADYIVKGYVNKSIDASKLNPEQTKTVIVAEKENPS